MDGDEATFWEPNPADPLSDWVLEIDLGRLVSATKVILRFAEEEIRFCSLGALGRWAKSLWHGRSAVRSTTCWLAVRHSPIGNGGYLNLI